MTSENEGANGQAEAKSTSTTKGTTRKTTTSRRQTKGSLVKAQEPGNGEVFVLDDNTRIAPTDSLPNHRPIALSDFTVVGSLNMAGDRPIMADTVEVFTTDLLPGHRPVAVSTLPISELDFLPGNRPIAPNDVVDPPPSILMGYLD
ncbi:MAG: hypothetical protein F6J95_014430 [Leptolyngbya sp. SIO1E4]|nr:hypothetical protein [Leptolyngbya sp. SIO1E4]